MSNLLNYYIAIEKKTGNVFLSDNHDRFNPINMEVNIWSVAHSKDLTDYIIMPYYEFINKYSPKDCTFERFFYGDPHSMSIEDRRLDDTWILMSKSKPVKLISEKGRSALK